MKILCYALFWLCLLLLWACVWLGFDNAGLRGENTGLRLTSPAMNRIILEMSNDGRAWTPGCGTDAQWRFYRVRRSF